ncbi:MAG TPA: hypothetical protein VL125_10005 [Pelobium sp.]|nr:hypothetical protein [Pelobium sp.]
MKVSLTYTQAMKLYKKDAVAIIKGLPAGNFKVARAILYHFLAKEKEVLCNWYYGLQMSLLSEADYCLLLKSKKPALCFRVLLKKGLNRIQLRKLKEDLIQLLQDRCIRYSGSWHNDGEQRYRLRLYSLPIEPASDNLAYWTDLVTGLPLHRN